MSAANPPIPGVPDPTPAQAPAPAAAAPAPAAAPAVRYADQNDLVRGKVNGSDRDYKISELLRQAQMGEAAEQKFARANQLLNENRAAVEFGAQVESLVRAGRVAEAQALIESRTGRKLAPERQEPDDGVTDPNIRALRDELAAVKQQLGQFVGSLDQVVTEGQTAKHRNQVQAAVQAYPLFQADPELAEVASVLATSLIVNPIRGADGRQVSYQDALGEVHAKLANALQRQTQAKHDTLTATAEALKGLPPQTGTPSLTIPEVPQVSKEDWASGAWRKIYKGVMQGAMKSV